MACSKAQKVSDTRQCWDPLPPLVATSGTCTHPLRCVCLQTPWPWTWHAPSFLSNDCAKIATDLLSQSVPVPAPKPWPCDWHIPCPHKFPVAKHCCCPLTFHAFSQRVKVHKPIWRTLMRHDVTTSHDSSLMTSRIHRPINAFSCAMTDSTKKLSAVQTSHQNSHMKTQPEIEQGTNLGCARNLRNLLFTSSIGSSQHPLFNIGTNWNQQIDKLISC